ncbi:UDP-glucuronosyltransferase 2C1-like [Lingula anatina]|uniref:UDP-glucuronosyltransferase 2C1-like n=1 Tax=Lingula anatina TaxID=7574 RepID=A0A1S3I4C9_LINAN|nr:UDP-glucuronosyltransferase 2C1-like [Lingula anatina]|eukprot:XP_013393120.1 UDP-glucuronosyltransferase 2C1-like [Lingula anatina]
MENYYISTMCLTIIYCMTLIDQVNSARFLGICMPFKSQLIDTQALLLGLADRGHEVYIVMPQPMLPSLPSGFFDKRIQVLLFKTRSDEFLVFETAEFQKNGIFSYFDRPTDRTFPSHKIAQLINNFRDVFTKNYTADMLKDTDFNKKLKDLKIDMVIVQNAFISFSTAYLLPIIHNIPYVSGVAFPPTESGAPSLPSIVPNFLSTYSDTMNFWQRTVNFLLFMHYQYMVTCSIPYDFHAESLEGIPKKNFHQILADSELFIVTGRHPALDFPQLTLPNTIFAGGMSAKPGKPLPKDLQTFMEGHKNGVIVVSFGSIASYLPDYVIKKMVEAFGKIKYGVIWKHTGPKPDSVTPNVKLLPWLPQNDLLAHRNTKLFISHFGLGGAFESFYHGVPVIGLPLNGDQYYNSNRAQHRGIAKVMDILYFTTEELVGNINTMIDNSSYVDKAKKLSAIYRDQPWTPQQLTTYWIEHVLKHGGTYLHSPTVLMSWYQYYLLDVIAFLLVVSIVVLTLCILCYRCCCRIFCKKKTSTKPIKMKTK